MKKILVFGAGKSAGVLIKTLLGAAPAEGFSVIVADINSELASSRIGNSAFGRSVSFPVNDASRRFAEINSADLVISLLPPALHILVARDCLKAGKDLLTASYVDTEMAALHAEAETNGLLFLCETGLDPGIDHMSAMRLIESIRDRGGQITGFFSHCGGLVAPKSDDNPWHYKISWNPANIVQAGRDGARFIRNGQEVVVDRESLFNNPGNLVFPGYGPWQYYANRDSTSYRSLYKLEHASDFLRTTIRHPAFMRAWLAVVKSGLIDTTDVSGTYAGWAETRLKPWLTSDNQAALDYLGFFSQEFIPEKLTSGAAVLQYLLETKLAMKEHDKDLVLMVHQVFYTLGTERRLAQSYFSLEGTDVQKTAMATTVGLPLARAAQIMLKKGFAARGVQVPVLPEIYEPLLKRLEEDGIVFQETDELVTPGSNSADPATL